jgi:hypothetical protein
VVSKGQRLFGEGHVAVCGAFATVDMALETRAIDIGALEEEGFVESAAQARDGRAGDLGVPGGSGRQEALDLLHPEDGGEPVGGVRTQERQRGPGTLQNGVREEAEAAVADAPGRGGEASDVWPVEDVGRQVLCREAVG